MAGGQAIGAGELPTVARRYGLPKTAQLLEAAETQRALMRMALPDDTLIGRPSRDPAVKLGEMARRGLDPGAIARLQYAAPLEVGLLAWDVLVASLLPIADEAGAKQLQKEALAIKAVLPLPGVRAVDLGWASRVLQLPNLLPGNGVPIAQLSEGLQEGELSAALELLVRGATTVGLLSANRARLIGQARILQRAHLTTLASSTFSAVASALRDPTALEGLLETQLDAGAFDSIPEPTSLPESLRAYALYRRAVARQDSVSAMQAYRSAKGDSPSERLVRADIEALRRPDAALDSIRDVVGDANQWRWAAEVHLRILAAATQPFLPVLDDYLTKFGNDEAVWLSVVSRTDDPDVVEELRARAVREVYALPHEPAAWSALAEVLGEPFAQTIDAELMGRRVAQSTMAA